jgi:MOSC domain-containing protein YiiM
VKRGVLHSVNVMKTFFELDGERSGINKEPIHHRVLLADHGVEGDHVLDTINHGGPHKAIYAYAREDAKWWESIIGEPIAPGRFGENLTTIGLDLSSAVIGERWHIGEALLEVSQPRIPCRTFSGFWNRPSLVKEFTNAARPGAYLRIIEEGKIGTGDEIIVDAIPDHGVTVAEAFRARTSERALVRRVLLARQLPSSWLDWAEKILSEESQPHESL